MANAVKEYYHDIDLKGNMLLNSRLHNLTTSERIILGTSLTVNDKGYQVYDTNYLAPYLWNGSVWLTSIGIIEWGSISGNLLNQSDLITYLDETYYSISNPYKFVSGDSITTNKIIKWGSDDTTITNSIITDNGVSITVGGNSTFNGTITANDIVSINKLAPTGTSLLRINGGAASIGNLFQFQNFKDAGLLKIGYFGNTGNRIEINGGGDDNAPIIKLYEKIGSSAPTLNVWINSNTIGGFTYFNAGNILINKTVNSIYKLDVGGSVRIGGNTAEASALLHLSSTAQGFLKPKMTNSQMLAITSPSTGLEVFNTTYNQSYFYNGAIWIPSGNMQYTVTSTYAAMIALSTPTTPTIIKVTNDENKSATRTMYIWFPDGNRQYLLQINDN